jgi:hypothetical protein
VKRDGGLQYHPSDGPDTGGKMIDPNPATDERLIAGDWNGDGKDTVAWVKNDGGLQYHPTDGPDAGGRMIDPNPTPDEYLVSGFWNGNVPKHIVDLGLSEIGMPYIFGAGGIHGPTGGAFDCSGLTMYAIYQATGIVLPHSADSQYNDYRNWGGSQIARQDLQPGDLVFFVGADGSPGHPGHVGVYIGNDQMVNAYDTEDGVIQSSLEYQHLQYIGAVRYWH